MKFSYILVFDKDNSNIMVIRFCDNDKKLVKKLKKLKKLSKSQKLTRSKQKLSKNRNLSQFDAKKTGLSFLTLMLRKLLITCS